MQRARPAHESKSTPHPAELQHADPRQLRTAARVLLVTDQPALAAMIRFALDRGQYVTRTEATDAEARAVLAQWQPHLAVVDLAVATGEPMAWLQHAAGAAGARVPAVPVIAVTARTDLKTRLAAFQRGADSVMALPLSPEEILARVLVIMRRTYRDAVAFTPTIRIGDLEIDIRTRSVSTKGSQLHLTSLEQSLLYLLAANAGRLITREEILDNLWGAEYAAGSNVVDRHVRNLRAKLQDDWRQPRFIATVPGRGYRLVSTAAAAS